MVRAQRCNVSILAGLVFVYVYLYFHIIFSLGLYFRGMKIQLEEN